MNLNDHPTVWLKHVSLSTNSGWVPDHSAGLWDRGSGQFLPHGIHAALLLTTNKFDLKFKPSYFNSTCCNLSTAFHKWPATKPQGAKQSMKDMRQNESLVVKQQHSQLKTIEKEHQGRRYYIQARRDHCKQYICL